MTLAEIKARIWERLEENASTPARYTSALANEYLLDGERYYAAVVKHVRGNQTVTQTANTLMFDLDANCIQVQSVKWIDGSVLIPLEPTTPRDLDETWALSSRWMDATATRASHYFIFGLNKVALFPMIGSGTETYQVRYTSDVPDDVSVGLTESTPAEDHELLVNYTVARFLLSEGKVEEGLSEFKAFKEGVEAAKRRNVSVDRLWSMSSQNAMGF